MSAAMAIDAGSAGDKRVAIVCLGAVVLAHVALLALLPAGPQFPQEPPARVSVTLIAPPGQPEAVAEPAAPLEQPKLAQPRKPEPKRTPEPPAVQAPSPPIRTQPGPAASQSATPTGEIEAAPPAAAAVESSAPRPVVPDAGAGQGSAGEPAEAPRPALVPPRYDAAYLDNPKPEYPRLARRLGEQGTVLLHVYVGAGGQPAKIEMRKSSGSPRLDQAARATVARWKFVPARPGDLPVGAWLIVPITFVPEG